MEESENSITNLGQLWNLADNGRDVFSPPFSDSIRVIAIVKPVSGDLIVSAAGNDGQW